MKKLALVTMLAAAAYGGWRWQHTTPAAKPAAALAFNRMWIDHLPTGEKDPFNVLFLSKPESIGGFAEETIWNGRIERFRFAAEGETLRAVFPSSGDREVITIKATACEEADMDFCLDVTGSKRGVARYYSRMGWERRGVAEMATFRDELLHAAN